MTFPSFSSLTVRRGRHGLLGALPVLWALFPLSGWGAEIAPFQSVDQSPLVQIYGLPAPGNATILGKGRTRAAISIDLANNFAGSANARERILLDGESLRGTFTLSHGFGEQFEAGVELPLMHQSGGFLDGFIEGWHSFFGLPDGGRPNAPKNRLIYRYERDGVERFRYTENGGGMGDLRLTGGIQLARDEGGALALRGALKLPSGESATLSGSGSTDFALWCTGQRENTLSGWGRAAIFGALGGLAKSRGEVLSDQQRYLIGFGSLGAGWSPLERIALKLQLSSHTPFYRNSELPELNRVSTLLIVGGTVALSGQTALDIGVSEDIAVRRSPDVSFHLGLSSTF